MIGEIIERIFLIGIGYGIGYGIVGTLVIEGIVVVIYHLIGKRGKDGEQR